MTRPPVLDVQPIYAELQLAKDAVGQGNFEAAERHCEQAWEAIPEPKYGWDSSYICTQHLVQVLRSANRYEKALSLVQGYLESGHHDAYEDGPYFWLGTLYFEKGDFAEAYRNLHRANAMSRGRCFREEDPKYKSFMEAYPTKGVLH